MVVYVVDRLLRRELLERRDVGTLVDDDFVEGVYGNRILAAKYAKIAKGSPVFASSAFFVAKPAGHLHIMPLGPQLRDMAFGEDLYPAAHF